MADTIYDVAIIGSGPAGYTAAIRAGQLGLKIALIESANVLGGTCLHVGCIPTKALLFNAELWDHLKQAAEYGIDNVDARTLNWDAVQKRKTSIVDKHTKGLDFLMKKNKVTVISGYGRLTGPAKDGIHTIDLTATDGAKSEVKTKNIILATGSDAKMIFGLKPDDRILTNIEILAVPQVPKSLIVIGAGAVGVEFSSIFRSFGTEVTIVEFLPRLLPPEDEEISKELTRLFKKRGIDVNTGRQGRENREDRHRRQSHLDRRQRQARRKGSRESSRRRGPRWRALPTSASTKPKSNWTAASSRSTRRMETAEPGIYAIGDIVAGLPQLAHSGSMSGIVAVTKIAGRKYRSVRRDRIPACTYSDPQIGSVGLTEAQAKEKGIEIKVGKFPFAGNSKATIVGSHDGFVKIVADAKYGEILGVHIIGPQATELIAEAVAVMELEGTIDELMFTIHAHPTISEAMLDAYAAVEGMAINA